MTTELVTGGHRGLDYASARAAATLRPDLEAFTTTFATNVFTMGSLSDQADPGSPYHPTIVPAYRSSKARSTEPT